MLLLGRRCGVLEEDKCTGCGGYVQGMWCLSLGDVVAMFRRCGGYMQWMWYLFAGDVGAMCAQDVEAIEKCVTYFD